MTKEEVIKYIEEDIAATEKIKDGWLTIQGYKAGLLWSLSLVKRIDEPKNSEIPNNWKTGKPTEEGWYLFAMQEDVLPFAIGEYDGIAFDIDTYTESDKIIAWQKIEPYKGEE